MLGPALQQYYTQPNMAAREVAPPRANDEPTHPLHFYT